MPGSAKITSVSAEPTSRLLSEPPRVVTMGIKALRSACTYTTRPFSDAFRPGGADEVFAQRFQHHRGA